jgi:large subunit ribosomal protein L2
MVLKIVKPTTPSQRHLITLNNKNLQKKPFLKKEIKGLKNSSGRNCSGKITIRHLGGGHKKKYRKINFFRTKPSIGIVCSLEYNPNRNSHIASIYEFTNNRFFYILAPKNLKKGDVVKTGTNAEIKIGHSLPLNNIPVGSFIHNISLNMKKPAQISRAAGTFSKITEKTFNHVKLKLSSKKEVVVSPECFASIGIVSNELFFFKQLGKAGRARWLNRRPTVRGVAMNPVDHPHGGGEGKKSGKGLTLWGKPVKSGKTGNKHKKKITNYYIKYD